MSSQAGFLQRQSLRLRITLAFVATGVLLAGILSAATFLAVRSFLQDQRITSATDETIVALQLARDTFRQEDAEPDQFVAQLQLRGQFEALVTAPDDFIRTTLALNPAVIPASLLAVAEQERVGYQIEMVAGARTLIFAGPLPPENTDLFLFFDLSDLEQTMSVLLRVLIVGGFVLVVIAGLVAQRVSVRILRPVSEVSRAAQRVAEGLLETRVQTATADEVGMLAASFNEMASAFQDMLDRERRFVANVSHELRTPLATLRTASELLEAHRMEFQPATREAVDLLAEDVGHLRRLVEELMEVSEVDAGRAMLRWEDVDLAALARAVVAKSRRDVPVDGDTVRTVSDKARLERILTNLIENAYAHGHGADVRVAVAGENGRCRIEVSDNGPGISPHDLPHLFDRFFKTDAARSRERGGVGLGLAIAMENAHLLGGTIDVRSTPGARTTFTVRIPHREVPPEEDDV